MRKIYIDRLFPNVNEMKLQHKLKINQESIMYITIPDDAEQITQIINNHITKYIPNSADIVITDATAGVGGNSISFAKKFKYVHAIELDKSRFNYLANNVNAYNLNNIKLYNSDCLDIIPTIVDHNVIFFDPPWGGKDYKSKAKMKLEISNIGIEDIFKNFFDKHKMQMTPKLIAAKLPKNYDVEFIYKTMQNNRVINNVYLYELNKMILIIIENCDEVIAA